MPAVELKLLAMDVCCASDGPWTTRACADHVGFTPKWIRTAIEDGVTVRGAVVKLEAERIARGKRRTYRIHLDQFVEFLKAIGWQRLPVAAAAHA